MEKLYDTGKARAIGVSNFSTKKLGGLLAVARIPPAVNQVECHPGWQQTKLNSFCQSTGIHLSVSLQYTYIFLCHLKARLAYVKKLCSYCRRTHH
jgi:diketogulonate reductase-like aldo/keto reductase